MNLYVLFRLFEGIENVILKIILHSDLKKLKIFTFKNLESICMRKFFGKCLTPFGTDSQKAFH